jgi:hypothetical protein
MKARIPLLQSALSFILNRIFVNVVPKYLSSSTSQRKLALVILKRFADPKRHVSCTKQERSLHCNSVYKHKSQNILKRPKIVIGQYVCIIYAVKHNCYTCWCFILSWLHVSVPYWAIIRLFWRFTLLLSIYLHFHYNYHVLMYKLL